MWSRPSDKERLNFGLAGRNNDKKNGVSVSSILKGCAKLVDESWQRTRWPWPMKKVAVLPVTTGSRIAAT
jgi:hypothetical protein